MRSNFQHYHEAYKKCRNRVTKLIEVEKVKYFNTKLKRSNSTECWQTINKLLNKQTKSITINEVKVNGNDLAWDTNVAHEFNNYFCSIGLKPPNDIPPTDIDALSYMTSVTTSFDFQDVTIEELRSVIKNF